MFFHAALANTISALNVACLGKATTLCIPVNKYTLSILIKLYDINLLQKIDLKKNGVQLNATITLTYFYGKSVLKKLRVVSTNSKKYHVSIKMLQYFTSKTTSTRFLISTSKGILTNQEAVAQHIGGLMIVSIFTN